MWNLWSDDPDESPFYFPNIFGGQEHEADEEPTSSSSRVYLGVFIVVMLALLVFFYLLYRFLPPLIMALWAYVTTVFGRAIITGALLVVASGMFWLRQNRRLLYGSIELCFGGMSIWQAVDQAHIDHGRWAVVIGAVYLVVRGCDNFVTGFKEYREAAHA
jgi:Na+/proline symporter